MQQGGRDEDFEEGDDDGQPMGGGGETPYGTREPQPYIPRDAQPFPQQQPPAARASEQRASEGDVDRLPSFITGGAPAAMQPQQARTAMTTSPTASRCIAAGGAIAARGMRLQGGGDGGDEPTRGANERRGGPDIRRPTTRLGPQALHAAR